MENAKIGVIGAGWWATEYHIPDLKKRDDVELVSVCKLEKHELEFVKEKFNFKFASTDYKEMLNYSPLDGVVIASPHYAHFEIAKAALEKNCHVLIEKPMTTNANDAEKLCQIAKEKNKEILIPHGFNFTHFMPKAEKFIADGTIGEIKHVDSAFSSSLIDLFQGIPLSESKEHTFKPKASTWSDPNKGGGYAWGQLSHLFGGVFKITHLEAEKAFCFSVPSPSSVDFTDAISVKFTNGATGSFSGCAYVPKGFGGTFYITVHGTKGTLYLDMEIKRERLLIRLNDGKEITEEISEGEGTMAYGTTRPLNAFVDICLNKNVANHGNSEIGLKTVKVLDAIYRSIKSEEVEKI
tara:strand:+ start:6649 stop:7704 length:1056 start_codon:yes stop_codon:yes gene_type:complete